MDPESILDSLTSSFSPTDNGLALPAAQDAVPHIKGTFNTYGSTDPVDKIHCMTSLQTRSQNYANVAQIGTKRILRSSCQSLLGGPN